jgi:ATP-dependent DNA ligase
MLLTEAFSRAGWGFEKYDGWRCLAEMKRDAVRLQSRGGTDATTWYGPKLRMHSAPCVGTASSMARCTCSTSSAAATLKGFSGARIAAH